MPVSPGNPFLTTKAPTPSGVSLLIPAIPIPYGLAQGRMLEEGTWDTETASIEVRMVERPGKIWVSRLLSVFRRSSCTLKILISYLSLFRVPYGPVVANAAFIKPPMGVQPGSRCWEVTSGPASPTSPWIRVILIFSLQPPGNATAPSQPTWAEDQDQGSTAVPMEAKAGKN